MAVEARFAQGLIGVRRCAGALLLAFFAVAANGQTPPPLHIGVNAEWLALCLDKLGAPALVARFRDLESPDRRLAACRCALAAPTRAEQAPREGGESAVWSCIGGAPRAETSPGSQADQIVAELTQAMPAAAVPRGVYRGAAVRSGLGADGCGPMEYPRAARLAGAEGTVRLAFRVRASGAIENVVVLKSAGPTREHRQLELVTMGTLKLCGASPATLDRVPVDSWGEIEIGWQIHR